MPQIGWFEILIIVILSIVIIGPKDFPVVLKKVGNWIGSLKRYFNEIKQGMSDVESDFNNEISIEDSLKKTNKNEKKDD